MRVERLKVSAFKIPTDAPESDGTLDDRTTAEAGAIAVRGTFRGNSARPSHCRDDYPAGRDPRSAARKAQDRRPGRSHSVRPQRALCGRSDAAALALQEHALRRGARGREGEARHG